MNNLELLKKGKTLVFGDAEPRYYKLEKESIFYSDDNKYYKKSNMSLENINNIKGLNVI